MAPVGVDVIDVVEAVDGRRGKAESQKSDHAGVDVGRVEQPAAEEHGDEDEEVLDPLVRTYQGQGPLPGAHVLFGRAEGLVGQRVVVVVFHLFLCIFRANSIVFHAWSVSRLVVNAASRWSSQASGMVQTTHTRKVGQ